MVACTFFGHRDAPDTVRPQLQNAIECLIRKENVTDFYVGTHGAFDRLAYNALKEVQKQYPHIRIYVVLAYMPTNQTERYDENSLLPEGIETVPKRYAIHYRNHWMLHRADYVVCYITHNFGGAACYVNKAKRQNKRLIEL